MYELKAVLVPMVFSLVCAVVVITVANFFITILFLLLMLGGLLDARARHKDYWDIRRRYFEDEWGEIWYICRKYRHSWCQRRACVYAMGSISEALQFCSKVHYEEMGYRWYHVFPDHTFSRRSPYLKRKFYRNLFFGTK